MAWTTGNPVSVGDPTLKSHYDNLWDNADELANIMEAMSTGIVGTTPSSSFKVAQIREQSSNVYHVKLKIVDIGAWDMSGTVTVNIAHGLTLATVRSAQVLIRNDLGSALYQIDHTLASTYVGGKFLVLSSEVELTRYTNQCFHSAAFDGTTFNRGWITLWYAT